MCDGDTTHCVYKASPENFPSPFHLLHDYVDVILGVANLCGLPYNSNKRHYTPLTNCIVIKVVILCDDDDVSVEWILFFLHLIYINI
jgi:hypothetical protein